MVVIIIQVKITHTHRHINGKIRELKWRLDGYKKKGTQFHSIDLLWRKHGKKKLFPFYLLSGEWCVWLFHTIIPVLQLQRVNIGKLVAIYRQKKSRKNYRTHALTWVIRGGDAQNGRRRPFFPAKHYIARCALFFILGKPQKPKLASQ